MVIAVTTGVLRSKCVADVILDDSLQSAHPYQDMVDERCAAFCADTGSGMREDDVFIPGHTCACTQPGEVMELLAGLRYPQDQADGIRPPVLPGVDVFDAANNQSHLLSFVPEQVLLPVAPIVAAIRTNKSQSTKLLDAGIVIVPGAGLYTLQAGSVAQVRLTVLCGTMPPVISAGPNTTLELRAGALYTDTVLNGSLNGDVWLPSPGLGSAQNELNVRPGAVSRMQYRWDRHRSSPGVESDCYVPNQYSLRPKYVCE